MGLDQRGIIAVAEIIAYIPLLCLGISLVVRYGFTKKAGWVYLVILAIIRIVGGVAHVLSETVDKNSIGLLITSGVCDNAGVTPLLMATLGFLQTAAEGALDNHFMTGRGVRLAGLVATVGLALAIAGGVEAGDASTEDDITKGTKLRRIGVVLFLVVYLFIVLFHAVLWSERSRLMMNRRKFLTRISAALPFLSIRVLYSILSSFAPSEESISPDGQVVFTTSNSGLEKFSSTNGSWVIFLFMSVLTEFVVVIIFVVTGLTMNLTNDYMGGQTHDWDNPEELSKLRPSGRAPEGYTPYAAPSAYAPPQGYAPQPYSQPYQEPYNAQAYGS